MGVITGGFAGSIERHRSRLLDAIARAERFLIGRASPTGWSDFTTPIGESTEWVTGYVATTLRLQPDTGSLLAEIGKHLASRQRRNGGWGYNARAPADADSTAAALTGFSGLSGFDPAVAHRARRFLLRHVNPVDGGMRTFRGTWGLRLLMRVLRCSFRGWTASHVCVSAAALLALRATSSGPGDVREARLLDYLRCARSGDGLWPSYWWRGPLYATAMVHRCLLAAGCGDAAPLGLEDAIIALKRASGGWDDGDPAQGSAFSTALAIASLRGLATRRADAARNQGLAWLLDHQDFDGGWPSVPILQIPHPDQIEPWHVRTWRTDQLGTGVLVRDQNRVFTTATVMLALRETTAEESSPWAS